MPQPGFRSNGVKGMNGLPTNGVWGYAPAGGRQVAVGVWGYAGLGTRQPAAGTEAMKQFNQILRPTTGARRRNFRPRQSASPSRPPPSISAPARTPPLSALSVRRRARPPPWSPGLAISKESIFTGITISRCGIWEPAVTLQSGVGITSVTSVTCKYGL